MYQTLLAVTEPGLATASHDPPPSYHDTIHDPAPPAYLPSSHTPPCYRVTEKSLLDRFRRLADLQSHLHSLTPMPNPTVDFGDTSNFITTAGKKAAKKAAKAAQQNKWANDSGDEGNKEGGEGEENGGGGDGGGNAGGGAGGDDGRDGGGWDDWNMGGGKKKKGKKGNKAVEEEEAKKKEEEEKQQQEEEEEREQAQAAAAAAAAGGGGGDLSWANAAASNPTDEWGAFTTTAKKGKKAKKGKVRSLISGKISLN